MSFPDEQAQFVVETAIEGIEVTQSLQYYHAYEHLTDALDRGPDNSLLLVANKAAYVRVHLIPGVAAPTPFITGELIVTRYHEGTPIKWDAPRTISPINSLAWADPNASYDQRRSFLYRSLNFVIPSATMAGWLQLEARIRYQGTPATSVLTTRKIRIDATHMQRLPIRGVFITYNGPDGAGKTINIAAPTMAQLQAVATDALAMYPVESTTGFSSAGGITWTLPLNDGVGGNCTPNWDGLTAKLATVRTIDGNRQDVIYYGLLPFGVPFGAIVGCGGGGVGTGDTNGPDVFAHEVGHALGLAHAPSCNAGAPDPNYPAYEPYDSAGAARGLIGEYGIDMRNAMVRGPRTNDFMGYCKPAWISLYTFQFMSGHARLVAGSTETRLHLQPKYKILDPYRPKWTALPDPPPSWWDRRWTIKPQPVISITGAIRAGRVVDVTVVRVSAVPLIEGQLMPHMAALLDGDGQMITSGQLTGLNLMPSGCGCRRASRDTADFAFQVLLSDVAPGARLAIYANAGEDQPELWAVEAPRRRPRITNVRATRRGRAIALQWTTDQSRTGLRFSVQFSKDARQSWNACATLIDRTACVIPIERLPEGRVVFRVLAHDGFNTVTSESHRVVIPAASASVAILSPKRNDTLVSGQPLLLWAGVVDQNGLPLTDEACRWQLDGRAIGTGRELLISAPSPGRHVARAVVTAKGGRASQQVAFRTIASA